MITALVSGRLLADPEKRTGASGKPFALARLAAHDGEADAVVSVIAFGGVADQLAALGKGDAVSMTGRASVRTWTDRSGALKAGLSVTADALLTAHHVRQRRAAMRPADSADRDAAPRPRSGKRQPEPAQDDFGEAGDDRWLRPGGEL